MRFGVLGPLVVTDEVGVEVPVAGAIRRGLLLRLLADRNRGIGVDALIEDVWGAEPPGTAGATLRSHVSHLRRLLGSGRIVGREGRYVLVAGDDELDAAVFEGELEEGRRALESGDAERASLLLATALARWRGTAFADADGAGWAVIEAARLEELRLAGFESWLDAELRLGHSAEVAAHAEGAVIGHPVRERLYAILMLALYREGRQAEALRAYQRVRTILAEELGLEPSPELRALEAQVLEQSPDLARPIRAPSGVVTFLLTDVVGSTPLWETAPVEMPVSLTRHDALVAAAVGACNGLVLKARGEGDSTFSVFARATDAVAAAAALQAAIGAEAWSPAAPIRVRMALHSGEAHERDGDYFGRTVNRAARLRAAAGAAEVLVSQATVELVQDDIPPGYQLVPLGSRQLRDLDRAETVHTLIPTGSETVATSAVVEFAVPLPPAVAAPSAFGLAGRGRERKALKAAFERALEGGPQLTLVAGEAGIGKTTLVLEVARELHDRAIVLYGRTDEGLGVPYQCFVEALGHLVDHLPEDVLQAHAERHGGDLGRLVPGVASRLPPPRSSDAETERFLLFNAVTDLLERVASIRPVMVVLDDLHWSGGPTLQLMRHLATSCCGPVSIVATYRDTDVGMEHPLADVLADFRRRPGVERVGVTGLAGAEFVELMRAAAGDDLDETGLAVAEAVRAGSEGNPFFAIELLRHLRETGVIVVDAEGRWNVRADLDDLGLPESVREVVGRRVARLGSEARRVLSVASVMGRDIDVDLLHELVEDLGADQILDLLESAVAAGVLVEQRPPLAGFTFVHALVQQTLYEDLGALRRRRFHRRIAAALEEMLGSQPAPRSAELAGHWVASGTDSDRAAVAARAAGDWALRSLAPGEAEHWYSVALDMHDGRRDGDNSDRCELLLDLAQAQMQAGNSHFRATAHKAVELAERLGRGDLLVRAVLTDYHRGVPAANPGDRAGLLERALDAVGSSDGVDRVKLLAKLGWEVMFNDLGRARAATEEAIAVAARLGDPDAEAFALAFSPVYPTTYVEWLPAVRRAVDRGRQLGDAAMVFAACYQGRQLTMMAAEPAEAEQMLTELIDTAVEVGRPDMRRIALAVAADNALIAGDTVEAERLLDESYAIGKALEQTGADAMYVAGLMTIRWHQGRQAELVEHVERLRPANPDLPSVQLPLTMAHGAGHLDDLVAMAENTPENAAYLPTLTALTEILARAGLAPIPLYERLLAYRNAFAYAPSQARGPVAHYLGLLAVIAGRPDDAEEHFARADEINTRMAAPFHQARTWLEWAKLRAQNGDRLSAVELAKRAQETAARFGCGQVERRAKRLMDTLV